MKLRGVARAGNPAIEIATRETIAELRQTWRHRGVVAAMATPLGIGLVALAVAKAYRQTSIEQTFAVAAILDVIVVSLVVACLGAARDRQSRNIVVKRLSPMPDVAYVVAKLVAATSAAVLVWLLLAVAAAAAGARPTAIAWWSLAAVAVAASVASGLIGLALGLWTNPQRAAATVGAILITFAVFGIAGLLGVSSRLATLRFLSPLYTLVTLGLALARGDPSPQVDFDALALAVTTLIAAVFVVVGIRRASS